MVKIKYNENRTHRHTKLQRKIFLSFCFFGFASACVHLKHFPALLPPLSRSLSLSSSQQPPVHPTTSPSSVHRASTSPPLRAKPPFGQVLSTYPFLSPAASVVFSRRISCNYIINLCTSTSLLLLCGTLFINKNTVVLLRMTFPH